MIGSHEATLEATRATSHFAYDMIIKRIFSHCFVTVLFYITNK